MVTSDSVGDSDSAPFAKGKTLLGKLPGNWGQRPLQAKLPKTHSPIEQPHGDSKNLELTESAIGAITTRGISRRGSASQRVIKSRGIEVSELWAGTGTTYGNYTYDLSDAKAKSCGRNLMYSIGQG